MKRIIAFLLTLSMLLSLCACELDEDALKELTGELMDAAAEWAKNAIKEWWSEATDSIWDSILGPDYTIHFDANGGINAPEDQIYRDTLLFFLTKETPTRPGYHFMGWTSIQEDNTPTYFSGKKPDEPLTQDITLYAVWGTIEEGNIALTENWEAGELAFPLGLWFDHDYTVECDDSNLVTIRCSCGAEITDRNISRELFACYKYNELVQYDNLSRKKQETVDREYALYVTQEYAPAILYFIGLVARDAAAEFTTLDSLDDFLGTLDTASTHANHYAIHENIDPDAADAFFGSVSSAASNASTAIGVLKAGFYFAEMCRNSGHPEASTVNFIATMQAVAAFTPASAYYDALLSTLSEGITLYFDCQDKLNALYTSLLPAFDGKTTVRDFLEIDYVIQAFNIANNSATYNDFLYDAPSAYEVIDFLMKPGEDGSVMLNRLTLDEKKLFAFYITLRLELEFEELAGIPLETYISYVS